MHAQLDFNYCHISDVLFRLFSQIKNICPSLGRSFCISLLRARLHVHRLASVIIHTSKKKPKNKEISNELILMFKRDFYLQQTMQKNYSPKQQQQQQSNHHFLQLLRLVATRVFHMPLLFAVMLSKKLLWLAQINVID